MREQLPQKNFYYCTELSSDDLLKIRKLRRKPAYILSIIISVMMLIPTVYFMITVVSLIPTVYFQDVDPVDFLVLLFVFMACTVVILKCGYYLVWGGRICAVAYGEVTDKQTQNKYTHSWKPWPQIYPWDKCVWDRTEEKPLQGRIRSHFKIYYYVDVSVCGTEKYMEHVCCFEEDYDGFEKGDRVIIVRFNNGDTVAVPASEQKSELINTNL